MVKHVLVKQIQTHGFEKLLVVAVIDAIQQLLRRRELANDRDHVRVVDQLSERWIIVLVRLLKLVCKIPVK